MSEGCRVGTAYENKNKLILVLVCSAHPTVIDKGARSQLEATWYKLGNLFEVYIAAADDDANPSIGHLDDTF